MIYSKWETGSNLPDLDILIVDVVVIIIEAN